MHVMRCGESPSAHSVLALPRPPRHHEVADDAELHLAIALWPHEPCANHRKARVRGEVEGHRADGPVALVFGREQVSGHGDPGVPRRPHGLLAGVTDGRVAVHVVDPVS